MRKLLSLALSALTLVTLAPVGRARQAGVGGSGFHKNDITYTAEVYLRRMREVRWTGVTSELSAPG